MAEVKSIPNNTSNWKDAASYLIKNNKSCAFGVEESVDSYAEKLKQANPRRPNPRSADVRWWPWLHHNIFDEDVIFKGPDPECKEPPASQPGKPENPQPVEPPPVEPPPPEEKPVSKETKDRSKRATMRAAAVMNKLKQVGLNEIAAQISGAREDALRTAEGESDDKAKKAMERLNTLCGKGEAEYQKIRSQLK